MGFLKRSAFGVDEIVLPAFLFADVEAAGNLGNELPFRVSVPVVQQQILLNLVDDKMCLYSCVLGKRTLLPGVPQKYEQETSAVLSFSLWTMDS